MESLSTNPSDALVFHFTQSNENTSNETGSLIEKNSDAERTTSTSSIIEETEPSSAEKVEIWMNGVKRVIFVPRVQKLDKSGNASAFSQTIPKPKSATEVVTRSSHIIDSANAARISVNSVSCENSATSRAACTNVELPTNRSVATVAPQINRDLDRTLSSSAVDVAKSCLDGIHERSSVVKRERPRSPKDCFDYRSAHDSITSLANTSDIVHDRPLISEDHYRRLLYERQPSNTVPQLSDSAGLQSSSTRDFAGISGSQAAADGGPVRNGYAQFALRGAPPGNFNGHHTYAVQQRYLAQQIQQVHRPVPVLTAQSFSAGGESRFGYPRFIQDRFPRPLVDTRWAEDRTVPAGMIDTSAVLGAGAFLPQDRRVSDYPYLMSAVDHCTQPTTYGLAPVQRPTLPVNFDPGLPPRPNYHRLAVPQLSVLPSYREQIRTGHDFGFPSRFLNPQNFANGVSCSTDVRAGMDLPIAPPPAPVFGFQHGGVMDSRHLRIPASAAGVPHSLPGLRKPLGAVGPYAGENLNAAGLSFSQPAVVNMGLQSRMSLLHNAYSNGMIPSTTNQEAENQRLNSSHDPVWMIKDAYQDKFSLPFAPSFLHTNLAQPGSCLSSSIENIISLSQIIQPPNINVSAQNGVYSRPDVLLRNSNLHNTAAVMATVASSCVTSTLTHSQPFCSTSSTSQMSGAIQRHQSPVLHDSLKTLNHHCDSGGVQKQIVSKDKSYAQRFHNSLQEVSTTTVNGNVQATVASRVLPEMPSLVSIDSIIQSFSSSGENNTESSSLAIQGKGSELCASVGSNVESLSPARNSVKTTAVSELHFDDKCKGAFGHSAKSYMDTREGHDALVPVEQRRQQETSGSPSGSPPLQFISDVMTSMEKDDVLVDQWLDSLMDNITESSRDSADSRPKPNKTCETAINNVAESRITTGVRKVSSQKKRRTWIGIKSIEAEMSSKSPDGKPKRRKRRRLTMRSDQSPDPSCDGSSDSWHPDGSESSESSNDTIISSLPSICDDSSTSSWSSNDSVTIGRRSRKHPDRSRKHRKKRSGSNPRAVRSRRRRRLRCRLMRMRETSPWQIIHPCRGETYECFVSLELLCLKGLKSINAGKVGEFLCCKSVGSIFAEDGDRSDRDDPSQTRKRKKVVQRSEAGISDGRVRNSSDTDDSYESWKPFKSKKRILRFQI